MQCAWVGAVRVGPAGVGTSSGSSLRPQPARESTWPRNGPKLLGDERITLLKPQAAPPEGFTGLVWHKRQDVTGGAQSEDEITRMSSELSDRLDPAIPAVPVSRSCCVRHNE